eukprot:NODE_4324_length_1080_cov_731.909091_g4125_i0.p1 GENE.NODE_4324_length_1080_cov_731.909091_g4125_i0~~NODE_4324_length_1080_cov_731.909091_g4125_i0.p1  ORF type:complete len:312 (+),score=91.73 NODE_4324_length_1080_cov_731.909091_g4125_i0:56-991(+)
MAPKKPAAKPAPKGGKKPAPKAAAAPPAKTTAKDKKKEAKKEKYMKPSDLKKQKAKEAKEALSKKKEEVVVKKKKGNPVRDAALFVPRPRTFGIGGDLRTDRNVTRFVRWPRYVRLQRQRAVLQRRLKVPPAVNQFTLTLNRVTKKALFSFAYKYRPETKLQRKRRLRKEAEAKAKDPKAPRRPRKLQLYKGLQRVTRLIEQKRAKLVMIAHDVVPLEMVVWLPTLCQTMKVPYCIVKDKAALGRLTGFKTCSCVAFVDIRKEDEATFKKLQEAVKVKFADKIEDRKRKWGGLKLGKKHSIKMARMKKASA